MAYRRFTDERRREIVAAYVSGEKTESICERLRVGKGSLQRFVKAAGVRLRFQYNKRQQVISLSRANPRLGPNAIAKEVGAHVHYVMRIRAECGLYLRKRNNGSLSAPTLDESGPQGLG